VPLKTALPAVAEGPAGGRSDGRRRWALAGATALLGVAALASLAVGVADVRLSDLLLFRLDPAQWQILTVSRVPRLLAILLAGSALSVAGLIMQRITQNRFVSPSTSGTVESAVLGILIATLLFGQTGLLTKMAIAIVTAVLGTAVFLKLLEHIRHSDPIVVALVGMMFGAVVTAVTVFIAFRRDLLQFLDIWTTGSFSGVMQGRYEPLFAVLAMGVIGYLFADRFTVVGMGEAFATNLGISYRTTLYVGLMVVSVTAAVVVVVVGAIPFLGLIIPNVVSLVLGDNVRVVLPATALTGAGFVLVCDVVGRLVRYPYEIPVSTVAGVIGGVVFLVLILRTAKGATP